MHTETEKFPELVYFDTTSKFRYLWLKYINGFDLSQHCARCLLGTYSSIFRRGCTFPIYDKPLNEDSAKYYYICGVTQPYVWRNNLHVAFRYKQGSILEYDDGFTKCVIRNAERIMIKAQQDYRFELFGTKSAYNTCRNWRFAYQITHAQKSVDVLHDVTKINKINTIKKAYEYEKKQILE